MTKEKVISRVTITQKTKAVLKEYMAAKFKRFGVKTLQEEAINDLLQMSISRAKEQMETWYKEMEVPEIK